MPWKNLEARKEYDKQYAIEHRDVYRCAQKRYRIRRREDLRYRVALKTGGRCHLCGATLQPGWNIDHKHPKSKGGTNEFENLWPACERCNKAANNNHEDDPNATDFPFGSNSVAFGEDYLLLETVYSGKQ